MRITKILWIAIPLVFLLAIAAVFLGPQPSRNPEVKLRQIAVQADPSDAADVERARKKIEEIHNHLMKGADFEQLALSESEAPNAAQGGDMGWLGRGILAKHHEDIVFRLEKGQYSDIIEDHRTEDLVYRIFYIEDRRNF